MTKIHLDIRDPSMTFLHRAGVAGLFAQLKYLQRLNIQPPYGLNWSLTAQTIELDWTELDRDALQWLFAESFQIDADGLIYFPAIEHSINFKHCNNCQKYPTEQLVWVESRQRFTQRYQKYIYERVSVAGPPQRKESSCEQVSRSEDLSTDQIQRIFSKIAGIEFKKKTGVLRNG